MGSSPFTATIPPASPAPISPIGTIREVLRRYDIDGGLVLGFSGGPDSTALALHLRALLHPAGSLRRVDLVHIDHGLDSGSADRASAAARLARDAGLPLSVERLPERPSGESLEAWARRARYEALARAARALGARWIATAHHADDQAETVLLRMLFGSGLLGLGGIAETTRLAGICVVRPALRLSRSQLHASLDAAVDPGGRLVPSIDPTNFDLTKPRSRIRHALLPELTRADPDLGARLPRIARAARAASDRIAGMLARHLRLQREGLGPSDTGTTTAALSIDRQRFARLADDLMPFALSLAHRAVGQPLPPPASVRAELARQARRDGPVRVDAGGGRVWQGDGRTLWLLAQREAPGPFSYSLRAPGSVDIAEASCRLRLTRAARADWMDLGDPRRVAFSLSSRLASVAPSDDPPAEPLFTVRSRRPGDAIRPFGHGSDHKLKSLLIDHRIPRHRRDALPLLFVSIGPHADQLVWVPGVTLDDRFRLEPTTPDTAIWTAELLPLPSRPNEVSPF